MERVFRNFALGVIFFCLVGCASSGYKSFYKPLVDPTQLSNNENIVLLRKGEKPTIFKSNNLNRDVRILKSRGFWPIGYSSFNGGLAGEKEVIEQAQRVSAVVVLVHTEYTDTRTTTSTLVLPDNKTTYSSATAYGSGGSATAYGTSTTYGTQYVPVTKQQRRYDQEAVYFAKDIRKPKIGIWAEDLTPEIRQSIKRNTGALVDIVSENSPAFYANIFPGDILIQLDGIDIVNAKQYHEQMNKKATEPGQQVFVIKILRDGQEKEITIKESE
jgi:hypothetical protein